MSEVDAGGEPLSAEAKKSKELIDGCFKIPPEGWDDTLRRALKKGIESSHVLQGYWENACEQAEAEGLLVSGRLKLREWNKIRESAVNSLIDNLNDMPKEDAITTLVDLYAEKVL